MQLNFSIKSALNWVVISSVSLKFLQIVSSIILIKLLSPNIFGVVTLIISFLFLVQGSMNLGFDAALIQKDKIDTLFNCAWTLEIIKSTILSFLMFFCIPFINFFFEIENINTLIYIVCLIILIDGFKNIGMITYRKELNFKVQFFYELIPSLINILFSILFAYFYRNAESILLALLVSKFSTLVLSYFLHSLRPKIEFNIIKFKSLFNFGIWITISSLISILRLQGMNFFISKFFGFNYLGIYNRSSSFSEEIFNQFSNITWKIGFPLFSKAKNDINLFNTFYKNTLKLLTILVFPLTFLIYFSSTYFVDILFDEEWALMSSLIKLFCVLGLLSVILIPSGILFQSIGKPKISTKLNLYLNLFTIIVLYPFTSTYGIQGVIYSLIFSVLFIYPFHYFELRKFVHFNSVLIYKIIFPPIFSCFIMLFFMYLLSTFILISSIIKLLIILLLGGVLYLLLIFVFERYFKLGLLKLIKN